MKWLLQPASLTQVTHLQRLWLYIITIFAIAFLVAPTLIVIPMSFSGSEFLEFPPKQFSLRWYENYFTSPAWMRATLISVNVAILSMLSATIIGTAAAYALWIGRIRFKTALWGLFALPIAIPVILLAVGSLFVFARLGLVNTTLGLTLMHTAMALPFVMIVMTSGFASYDMNQEQAARSLGATRLYAFITVTLPQIRFSIVSAMLFSFFSSFDEVVVAMFISTGSGATLNRKMFNSLRDQVDPTIAAISTCLVTVSILLIVIGQLSRSRAPR
ncbi:MULTISPECIES: ABC transporter permease [unclassified Mesorhizobium]|uniref:ABC transporter permease n=1 Tax=unclassified Mesorhizobium TaxID=325217 RepID=UPI000FD554DA|nr:MULTISPECIES: ABC transporter permease [unclassified Mesorhizobium]RVB80587.1 ABC transporter permease [Mesorhizobium sp. M6A.T.Cr.TU.014.01.1.1]RWQ06442.1 MAG: ABC transporter permease [Mesorhizobium sp.]RWQ10827.1 MAG: ABC transporter permease [Mesorhizobium sp.]